CNYWPEARAALINGLRNDPNECVRYEAALALLRGCCCSKKIMDHLKHSANGDDKDGFPGENSWRVREAASEALARCAAVVVELGEPVEQKKKREATLPPQAMHGKGLAGIFASATMAPTPSKPPPPATKEPAAAVVYAPTMQVAQQPQIATMPAPTMQVPQQSQKRGLLQRIDWAGSRGPTYQVPDSNPAPLMPAQAESNIVPTRGVVIFDANGAR